MIWLALTHHSKETQMKRMAIFTGFTFFSGMSLGPVMDWVIDIDPRFVKYIVLLFRNNSTVFEELLLSIKDLAVQNVILL